MISEPNEVRVKNEPACEGNFRNEYQFRCNVCSRGFSKLRSLKLHERIHEQSIKRERLSISGDATMSDSQQILGNREVTSSNDQPKKSINKTKKTK